MGWVRGGKRQAGRPHAKSSESQLKFNLQSNSISLLWCLPVGPQQQHVNAAISSPLHNIVREQAQPLHT